MRLRRIDGSHFVKLKYYHEHFIHTKEIIIMAWKTLTKEAFPQINKRQYLVDEYTVDNYTEENPTARISTYRSKAFYIIAIDSENRPARCRNCEAQLDDRYILRLCQAEHMTWTDPKTGKLLYESKEFYCTDDSEGTIIYLDDENLEHCKYKQVRLESILG